MISEALAMHSPRTPSASHREPGEIPTCLATTPGANLSRAVIVCTPGTQPPRELHALLVRRLLIFSSAMAAMFAAGDTTTDDIHILDRPRAVFVALAVVKPPGGNYSIRTIV